MRNLFLFVALGLMAELAYAEGQPAYCLLDDGSEISEAACDVLRKDHAAADQGQEERREIDLINCKWKNGETMSEDICASQRSMLPSEERTRIGDIVRAKEAQESAERLKACAKKGSRDITQAEKTAIRRDVESMLKDPESARFKWMRLVKGENLDTYCGLLNAKNSYGGYVGFKPFHTVIVQGTKGKPTATLTIISDDKAELIDTLCTRACYTDFSTAKP